MLDIIAVAGIDGAGKTTACHYIYDQIIKNKYVPPGKMYYHVEPTRNGVGYIALDMLKHGNYNNMELTLLLLADRLQHIKQLKQLGNDIVVVMDRFMLCTWAYQGIHIDGSDKIIDAVHQSIVNDLGKEHIHNILLDVEPIIAFNRMVNRKRKLDATETRGEEFFESVREAYLVEITNPMFNKGYIVECNEGLDIVKSRLNDVVKNIFEGGAK